MTGKRLLLAAPRGYCAGVDRAVETVERALDLAGDAPVYVRKEIVHNLHVVSELSKRGAVFVNETEDVPEGATVVFSAHGVAPSVHAGAARRSLNVIDATCPLVTKVHSEAKRFAARGYTIVLIGHEGHEEVALLDALDASTPLVYLTQTTLSVDETREIIAALRARFPHIEAPSKEDICYATSNRQAAVKALAVEVDLVLVIGSRNSSNSNRLVEVARDAGVPSHLIEDESAIDAAWLDGIETIGITSGASAPESLVRRVVGWFAERGVTQVDELHVVHEDVSFNLPREIRRAFADDPRRSSIR